MIIDVRYDMIKGTFNYNKKRKCKKASLNIVLFKNLVSKLR